MTTPHDTSTDTTSRTAPALDAPWSHLRTAAHRLSVPDDIEQRLLYARQRQQIAIPFERDDGTIDVRAGYRVRHDDVRGPYIGPHRYVPGLTIGDCAGLAVATAVTAALADVPFGGAAGGIDCDPETLSWDERARLTRAYARRITDIGPNSDVLVPDLGTDERTMARAADAVAEHVDGPHTATAAGKPAVLGGSREFTCAGGHSVAHVVRDILETDLNRSLSDGTVAVYGTSTVGATAARLLDRWGSTIVALCSDHVGLAVDGDSDEETDDEDGDSDDATDDGIDTTVAPSYLDGPGAIDEFSGGTMTGTENVLEADVDVLVLAGSGTAVTARNAETIRADLVVEGAYGAVTAGGQRVLEEQDVAVVPAVLSLAGKLSAASLEWRRHVGRSEMSDTRMANELSYAVIDAVSDVRAHRVRRDVGWRDGAYELGLSRLVSAHEVVR
ncbi:Glu/Leu/Phe/Val family dehydrogenase [Natrialba asiatica]|uniref:Glutamate dehydrogenase n=1 Tax=Natrialba asiatica (strain ATCC 700177 / DSM 12278 / JCM 9576 / FERM P-10747 / NBRC 102637 / 172P1) TaxID=29540 RepID=M0ALZ9_NATA1|nr:Glu/Leu/Phe/Val dehydrogenase dimerization domain-containing protein [Natrialba asiatica]ELY99544.1 Glu/Leu/Phe/Val dehydrogenase [Natrialba asiatica DSM 12278]